MNRETLRVGIAQLTPVWLDKSSTLELILDVLDKAAAEGVELLVFGEAFWPGYPFWLAYLDGAAWELPENKELHAHYLRNAVVPENGDDHYSEGKDAGVHDADGGVFLDP